MTVTENQRATLVALQEKFSAYRKTRVKIRARFPEDMWLEAACLARESSFTTVARSLGLDVKKLRKLAALKGSDNVVATLPSSPIRVAPVIFSHPPSSDRREVEIRLKDDRSLFLKSLSHEELMATVRLFLAEGGEPR